MAKIDLPSGGWASLREPEAMPERLRRPVIRLATGLRHLYTDDGEFDEKLLDDASLDLLDRYNDAGVVAFVAEWSYTTPVSADALLDLPAPDYDALRSAVAPLLPGLRPNFEPTADKDSPTTP